MRVLIDTSIWVDHFRKANLRLKELLEDDRVMIHRYVVGEIACGSFGNRAELMSLLQLLPGCEEANFDEVLEAISSRKLYGKGVGFVDACLATSCLLTPCLLWTADKRLRTIASELKFSFPDDSLVEY